jgi:hypothetical protein
MERLLSERETDLAQLTYVDGFNIQAKMERDLLAMALRATVAIDEIGEKVKDLMIQNNG